ncbi:MAG: hypothetical protein ONB23_04140 [candidate division KSB1 bacterium]|nr:hypothetical protein [candidate division KSB1 bacterium]
MGWVHGHGFGGFGFSGGWWGMHWCCPCCAPGREERLAWLRRLQKELEERLREIDEEIERLERKG